MGHLNTNQSGNGRTVPAHQLTCNHDEYGGLHQTVARNTHSTLFYTFMKTLTSSPFKILFLSQDR